MTSGPSAPTIYPVYCHAASPTLPQWCPLRAADIHVLKDVGVVLPEETPAGWAPRSYKVFHYGNHPIKWIKIVGVVVAIDEFSGRKIYTLDDSSGACVECSCVAPVVVKNLDLGVVPAHLDQGPRRLDSVATAKSKGEGNTEATTLKGMAKAEETKSPEQGVNNPMVPWDLIDVGTVVKVKGRIGSFRDMVQVEVVSVVLVKTTDGEVKFWNEAWSFKKEVLGKEWVVSKELDEKLKRKDKKRHKKGWKGDKAKTNGEEDKLKRKRKELAEGGDRNAVKRLLEKEMKKRVEDDDGRDAAKTLLEQETKLRAEDEGNQRGRAEEEATQRKKDAMVQEEKRRKRKELEGASNRSRYPSFAVRKAAAGKYDLLGI